MGTPEQVAIHLNRTAENIASLPLDFLAKEVQILRVEDTGRGATQVGLDLSVRFGPRGVGLIGWPEHGLRRLEQDEIVAWARQWFTKQNAALWCSGPLPETLDLRLLPDGDLPTRKPPRASLLTPRTWVGAETATISVSVLTGTQDRDASAAMSIARDRAFEQLRLRDAVSYHVESIRMRLGGGQKLEYLVSDVAESAEKKVFEGLAGILDTLTESGPSEVEIERLRQRRRAMVGHPQMLLGVLNEAAENRVLDSSTPARESISSMEDTFTISGLQQGLCRVMDTLLAIGPDSLGKTLSGWELHDDWSLDQIDGVHYQPLLGREKGELVVGLDGISWELHSNLRRTVRWSDALACFTWDNGVRNILGPTGASVAVVPWNWRSGGQLTQLVDEATTSELRIRLGEGDVHHGDANTESLTDVRWLATIVGARIAQRTVDVVVDIDGIFLLHGGPLGPGQKGLRIKETRWADHQTLLSGNESNRWIAVSNIRSAKISSRLRGMLTIETIDDEKLKVTLASAKQIKVVKEAFERMLGDRFDN
jgi:hypothetical protein